NYLVLTYICFSRFSLFRKIDLSLSGSNLSQTYERDCIINAALLTTDLKSLETLCGDGIFNFK
ncbi:hypothetical protein, partial [Oleiphilus sp. HI0128]|uniref:hypothetical protein n=1 Tax=Oleiphilus sp. HI0128 TaxID=1822267 RepID=UPI001E4E868B